MLYAQYFPVQKNNNNRTIPASGCNAAAAFHTFHDVMNSEPMTHVPILSPLLADLPLGLVLIRQKALVGHLPGSHKVYKITKIAVIPLSDEEPQELELEVCVQNSSAGVMMFPRILLMRKCMTQCLVECLLD